MSAPEQALIDQGDRFLDDAFNPDNSLEERHHCATMACAHFLRAGILARQEAMLRARTESQQVAEAIRRRQKAAQQEGPGR